jgi:hypothetical protein
MAAGVDYSNVAGHHPTQEGGGTDYYTGEIGKSNWGERVEHEGNQYMNDEHKAVLDDVTTKLGFDPAQVRATAEQWGADGANGEQVPEVYENGNYLLQQSAVTYGMVADPSKSFEENNANYAQVINAANAAAQGKGSGEEVLSLLQEYGSPKVQELISNKELTAEDAVELIAFDPHQNGAHMWGGAGSNPDSLAWTFMHSGSLNYREPEGEVASHGFSNDQHQGYQGPDGRGAHAEEAAQAGYEAFNLDRLWA